MSDPQELQTYRVSEPHGTPAGGEVRLAGVRWTIESGDEAVKYEVGVDHW